MVGLPVVARSGAGPRRRRLVPGAVPARVRRPPPAHRDRRGRARTGPGPRSPPPREGRSARRRAPGAGRECHLHRARCRDDRRGDLHGRDVARLAGPARVQRRPRVPPSTLAVPVPLLAAVRPAAAAALLAAAAAAALLAQRTASVAAIVAVLLAVCLRAPASRRRLYLVGAVVSGL